jgi:uncharacterized membrane protein
MAHADTTEREPQARAARRWAPPRWAAASSVLLSAGGLGVSAYLTVAHFAGGSTLLACPETGVINCEKVTTSPESIAFGLPVAVLGLAFFSAMVVLSLPRIWRRSSPVLRALRVSMAFAAVGFVVYLIYTELLVLHAICLWCTAAHVLALSIFGVVLVAERLATLPPVEPDRQEPAVSRTWGPHPSFPDSV